MLTGGGVGAVIVALINKFRAPEDRRAVNAVASRDEATGGAAVIAATANAFTEVTSSLREEIERLQGLSATFEADLAAAHARAVELEALVTRLREDLDRVRAERDAALERVELLNGQLRQQQQVMASMTRTAGDRP